MTSGFTPDSYAFTAQYDAENRLMNISYTDSNNVLHSAMFTYDANGFIAKQVVDGVETRFVRDTNYNVIQERDSNNNVTRAYVWDPTAPGGIGGLLEMIQGGGQYDYLYDGKGNVSAVIDANQNVVASYAYNPFGRLLAKSGTLDQPYQFSTKPYYEGYGIVYYGYRFGDPVCMKWLTRDPSGEDGGLNLYKAMNNNLINIIDALGLANIGFRPLAGYEWIPYPIQHEQIWYDDNTNIGYFDTNNGTGILRSDYGHTRAEYNFTWNTNYYRDDWMAEAVTDIFNQWNGSKYTFGFHDCQDFVNAVLDQYLIVELKHACHQ